MFWKLVILWTVANEDIHDRMNIGVQTRLTFHCGQKRQKDFFLLVGLTFDGVPTSVYRKGNAYKK